MLALDVPNQQMGFSRQARYLSLAHFGRTCRPSARTKSVSCRLVGRVEHCLKIGLYLCLQFARSYRQPMEQRSFLWKLIDLESGAIHTAGCFRIFHECVPDKPSPCVLRHYHRDPCVNSNDVTVIPFLERVECIHESIAAPRACTIAHFDGLEDAHCSLWHERERTCRRTGDNGSVNRSY